MRNYNTQKRYIIKDKLKNVKDVNKLLYIFNVLSSDKNFKYTNNINGLYFNINILSDETITIIDNILNINNISNKKIEYMSYNINKFDVDEEQIINDKLIMNMKKLKIKF